MFSLLGVHVVIAQLPEELLPEPTAPKAAKVKLRAARNFRRSLALGSGFAVWFGDRLRLRRPTLPEVNRRKNDHSHSKEFALPVLK